MSFVDVELHDLLEQLVERLVRVRHDDRALIGPVVIDVVDDLHGHVRLARARRSDHLQTFVVIWLLFPQCIPRS